MTETPSSYPPEMPKTQSRCACDVDRAWGVWITTWVLLLSWIAGLVLAPGWWKLLGVFFPIYPWYLVMKSAMHAIGWI